MAANKEISIFQFLQQYGTKAACEEKIKSVRWPDGIVCPKCNYINPYTTNRGYKCRNKECYFKFSTTSGTFFANGGVPLSVKFLLIYMMASNRKSISSRQISRDLGITQASAWKVMHKLRLVFEEKHIEQLSGIIEVDECFIGKGNLWTRWGSMSTRKTPIVGMLQRGGRVIIKIVENRGQGTLSKIIIQHVLPGSTVYTDGWKGYNGLKKFYSHDHVAHSRKEYTRGDVHVNGIENVWSYFKKNIRNGHHFISGKHVQRYCNEVCWKFNNRHLSTMQRFDEILKRCLESKKLIVEFKTVRSLRAA